MAKGGVTLDTVMINIESDAGKATSNIDNLAKSLERLKSSIKGGFNNINKLADALKKLNKSSEGLKQTIKNMDNISKISGALKSLDNIANPKGLNSAVKSLEKLPQVINKIDGKTIKNVTRVSNELAVALSPLAVKLGEIGQGFSAISQLANKYGVSVTKVKNKSNEASSGTSKLKKALSSLISPFKKVLSASQGFTKSTISGFKSMNSKIKQIGLSLLGTRTIFTATRKAISEYMNMDKELSDSVTNLWRALGAQLVPAVEGVLYLFKQFVRVIYSVVKAITGIDFIARANAKAMSGWGKSAKDTLGSLQKFDDLNVVDFGKSTGEDAFIDLQEIDLSPIQKIIDLTKELIAKFKEALDTGKWEAVGVALGSVINGIFDFINVDAITSKLKEIATNFGEFLNGAIMEIDWSKIGGTLGGLYAAVLGTINSAIEAISWEGIGEAFTDFINRDALKNIFTEIGSLAGNIPLLISEMINGVDWSVLMQNISEALIAGVNAFTEKINNIDFELLGENIKTAILNIDWAGIITSIIDMAKGIVSGAGGLLDGLFGTTIFTDLANTINDVIQKVQDLGSTITETLGENTAAGKIFKTLERILGSVISLVGGIANTLLEWTVSEEFQSMISLVSDIVGDIFDFVDELFKRISDWWNGDGGKVLKNILIDLTNIINSCLKVIKPILDAIWEVIIWAWDYVIEPLITYVSEAFDIFLTVVSGIVDFIVNIFQGDIKGAFESIGKTVEIVGEKIKSIWKTVVNFLIGCAESFVNYFIRAINKIIKAYNGSLGKFFNWLGVNLTINEIKEISLPRLETGTNEVPYDNMLAVLHKGEAVVPKKYNPAIGGGNSQEMLDRFDRLIFLMENQEQTTNVYVGNKKLYEEQKKYNKRQYNKYGTLEVT